MDSVLYMCAQCNEPLDSNSLQNHVCWQNVLVEPAFNETTEIENDGLEIQTEEVPDDLVTMIRDETKKAKKNKRSEWTEEDVHRLIAIYTKNYKLMPKQDGMHHHYFWDRVMKDLKPYGNFSRFLVQTKIKKLKTTGRLFTHLDPNTKWPFYGGMCEIFRLEDDSTARNESTDDKPAAVDSDNEPVELNDEVQGLRRWTIKETRHLLEVYKKHLPRTILSGNRRKTAWDLIIADLDYELPMRFSMIQIRSRIRNVINTYRTIVAQKRKKQITHWPLFRDVADVLRTEREIFNRAGVMLPLEDDQPFLADEDVEYDVVSWNCEETQELITAYLSRLTELNSVVTEDTAQVIWEQIADHVNSIRRRKVTANAIQNRITFLRMQYAHRDEKSLGPLYNHLRLMVEAEEIHCKPHVNYFTSVRKRRRHGTDDQKLRPVKRKCEDLPAWFVKYSEDASRRHREKIAVHRNMIDVLERVIM